MKRQTMEEYVMEREKQKNAYWNVFEDAARIAKDAKMAALFTDATKHLEAFIKAYGEFAEEYAEDIQAKSEKRYEEARAKWDAKVEQKADKECDKTAGSPFDAIFGHIDDEEENCEGDNEEDEDFECRSEPKKPEEIMNVPARVSYDTKAHGVCPTCGGIVDSTQNFCPNCSQTLKWEDDDDDE